MAMYVQRSNVSLYLITTEMYNNREAQNSLHVIFYAV